MVHYLPKSLEIFIRKFFYALPASYRFYARKIYYYPIDLLDTLFKKRHKYQPPKGKVYTGSGGDFLELGKDQLGLLVRYAFLETKHKVLDVGCGIGRTAIPLTEYLDKEGAYEGFDVIKEGVDWCKDKIGQDFSNFNFTHVALRNDLYNNVENTADVYTFPYQSDQFDVCFLFSVFTHMQPDEVLNYLNEIKRTLKKGGRCLVTFFSYTSYEEERMLNGDFDMNFSYAMGEYRLMSKKVIAANVAFQKKYLYEIIETSGLKIENIIDGFWKGEKTKQNIYQDVYILIKS